MALPPPPWPLRLSSLMAVVLTVAAGSVGLVAVVLEREVALATKVLGEPFPSWFFATPGRVLLIIQAVLVIVGVAGGMFRSFKWTVFGILVGMVFVTPVGLLTALPAVSLLVLILPQRRYFFREFRPRWHGPGPPPPGPW